MAARFVLLLVLVPVLNLAFAMDLRNRYFGGSLTVVPQHKNLDGTFQLEVRSLQTTNQCHASPYACLYGGCGSALQNGVSPVAQGSDGLVWCAVEAKVKMKLPHNHPVAFRYPMLDESQSGGGAFWIPNVRGSTTAWGMMAHLDLGTRSDTQGPNSPPVSAMLPIVRVTRNCPRTFRLMVFDPDGDRVKCRVPTSPSTDECGLCGATNGFTLDQDSCSLTYTHTGQTGNHPIELVVEDFPNENIKLFYSLGYFTIKRPLSEARPKRFVQQTMGSSTTTTWTPTTTTIEPPTKTTNEVTTTAPSARIPTIADWSTTTTSSSTSTPPTSTMTTTVGIKTAPSTIPTAGGTTTTPPATITTAPSTTGSWTSTLSTSTTTGQWNPTFSTTTITVPPTTSTIAPSTTTTRSWTPTISTPTTTAGVTATTPSTTTTEPWTTTLSTQTTTAPSTTTTGPWTPTLSTATTTAPSTSTTGPWTPTLPAPATTAPPPTSSASDRTNPAESYYMTSIPPLSKIPLQFTVYVDSFEAPSCLNGDYFPVFLEPTPANGENLPASVSHPLEIKVRSTAGFTTIDDLVVIGPGGISTSLLSSGLYVIKWKPTVHDLSGHYPVCFVAEARDGFERVFQSEPRCVTVHVTHFEAVVTCAQTTMKVEVKKNNVIKHEEDKLHLKDFEDASCSLKKHSNATHLVAVVPLNACGTQTEENKANITFRNQITSADPDEIITRNHVIDIAFSCAYPKKINLTLGFRHKDPYAFQERGFGTFTFEFEFFQSQRFRQQVDGSTYPVEVYLKQMIYMQIQATSSIPNTELFVESCRATPYDNPESRISYTIIENGCVRDPTVRIFSSSKSVFRFGMEAFEFIGAHDEVYITCSVLLCESGVPGTRCSQGCIESGSRRRRREAPGQTSSHFISQGPLHLRKASPSEAPALPLNLVLNLVLAVGCLVVCVVVICRTRARRSRTQYQLLPTSEFH
ncbi:unnamed protein product [Ophioblennius macclurei]